MHNLPIVGRNRIYCICPSLYIYSIFGFEPMHNFHLGISRLIKNEAFDRLQSEMLQSSSLSVRATVTRTFKSIRREVLRELNIFLSFLSRNPIGYNVNVDFSIDSGKGGFN